MESPEPYDDISKGRWGVIFWDDHCGHRLCVDYFNDTTPCDIRFFSKAEKSPAWRSVIFVNRVNPEHVLQLPDSSLNINGEYDDMAIANTVKETVEDSILKGSLSIKAEGTEQIIVVAI